MGQFVDIAQGYLAEKRAVGFKMEKGEAFVARLDALRSELGCPENAITKGLHDAWTTKRPGETESSRAHRVSQVRGLAEYMARMGYEAYIAPGKQAAVRRGPYDPYIFTKEEVSKLLSAADEMAEGDGPAGRNSQMALMLRLLYTTGMRCGEACSLTKADVDLDAGIVTVRHAKNDKDRLVPLHPAMAEHLRGFSNAASLDRRYQAIPSFWLMPQGCVMSTGTVYAFFRKALWAARISHGGRGKGPRVHDLRFTFACHRLQAWVAEAADVNALLPVLAAYMGHADTRCTEYYLRLTAQLYPTIVDQVEKECGWVVPR